MYSFLSFMAMNFVHLIPKNHKKVFEVISNVGKELHQPVFIVGGYVRDYYLDRLKEEPDIDFVTLGSGIKFAEVVHKNLPGSHLTVFKQFGTAQIKTGNLELEFVGARRESYRRDSRKPIVEDGTLEDDQERRDLTINAMSWSLNEQDFGILNDPFGGLADLKNKIIRTPIDPDKTFDDDPLRMMRAVRFASQLGFNIADETFNRSRKWHRD